MAVNETLNIILSRRSVRAYQSDPVPRELLSAIVEAGQAAPYVSPDSRHFSVIGDRTLISRLNQAAIAEGVKIGDFQRNLFSAPGFDGTYGASEVIIISGNEKTVQYEGVCAASVQNMLIAARSLGLASCWVYFPIFAFHGAEAKDWRAELRIPEGYKPCAAVLLGYGTEGPAEKSVPGIDERYKNAVDYL